MKKHKRSRSLSKKAERNALCRSAVDEIRGGNCSRPDMWFAVNEVCRRVPRNLQAHLSRVLAKSCGGRLSGLRGRR